jgi:heme/copper-type cytochrome/quinol oxidase subunit 2
MDCAAPSAPTRRWLIVAGVLAIASALVAHRADRLGIVSPVLRVVIALLPIPFFLLFIYAEFRWISEQDEFHRRVFLESLAIAFPLVIVEGVAVEALQTAGYLASVSIGDIWPLMALTWVPALLFAARRYR